MVRGRLDLFAFLWVHQTLAHGSHASSTPFYPVYGRVTPCWANQSLSNLPFCDSSLEASVRAADLVARLTLAEAIAQLDNNGRNSVPRLGLDLYQYHSEGLHGVRTSCLDLPGANTTEFPQVTGMAATVRPHAS